MSELCFEMLDAWTQYAETISDPAQRLKFYDSVANYGVNRIEPQGLTPSMLEYFNVKVKPTIDRQHKEREKRKVLNARRAARRKEKRAQKRAQLNAVFTILDSMKGGRKQ